MNSSAKRGRILHAVTETEDIFIMGGESVAAQPALASPMMTVSALIADANARAAAIVAAAEAEAARLLADAHRDAGRVTDEAHQEGFLAGREEGHQEVVALIDLVRSAANQGKEIRDSLAQQSASVVARATALATRRIVARIYELDPAATADVCDDALRAAAGQEVLAIRVASGIVPLVQAALGDAAAYVRPDDSVEVGGWIIDLRHGTIDATLSSRLTLLELALAHAGGEAA